jgi:hypothetical protein
MTPQDETSCPITNCRAKQNPTNQTKQSLTSSMALPNNAEAELLAPHCSLAPSRIKSGPAIAAWLREKHKYHTL